MNNDSLNILRHIFKEHHLVHKVEAAWFYDKKDWVVKVIVESLKENPKMFDKSLLIDRLKHSNFNIAFSVYEKVFEEPSQPFEAILEVTKKKYTRAVMKEQLAIVQEMINVEDPAKVVNKLLQMAESLPKFEKETKGLLDNLSDENEALVNIHTADRPALRRLMAMKGSVIVIGGNSGHHKTNNGISMLCNALDANVLDPDFTVAFFSKEMEWKQIRDRVLAYKLKIPFELIFRREVKVEELRKRFRDEFPYYVDRFKIIPSEGINSPSDVAEILMQQRPAMWVFDYIQLLADEKVVDVNTMVRSSAILFKTYSKIFNNICVELAQTRKMSDTRKLMFPVIDDIEYAGSIKHLADSIGMCWWAYKHNSSFDMSVYITSWQKVRNGNIFNEFLEMEPEICYMHHSPKFYIGENKKLKSEYIKYYEI